MQRITAVVIEKAFFEIGRASDILLFRMRFRSEKIDVLHLRWAFEGDVCYLLACQP
jgi:hypothetical protein